MQILDSPSGDPQFNIAAEEYLLKEKDGEYAFFYCNKPSIIIGKHQNAWAEINIPWTRSNNIPVVRRISGGGTVWHDEGNLNFSFILNGEEGKLVNFREYASPVLDFLIKMGVPAEFGKRNEMLVNGLKVSGNAEHVSQKRVLHHGTLLFSSDLSKLNKALDTNPEEYEDKAVQSVRSKTGNIRDFLTDQIEIPEFRNRLVRHIAASYDDSEVYIFTRADNSRIEELVREKYSRWKWNIGYSPVYSLSRIMDIGGMLIRAELKVEKGQIKECSLLAEDDKSLPGSAVEPETLLMPDAGSLSDMAMQLTGMEHDPDSIGELISKRNLVKPEWIDKFVEGLF